MKKFCNPTFWAYFEGKLIDLWQSSLHTVMLMAIVALRDAKKLEVRYGEKK